MNHKILFMDEPTANLDPKQQNRQDFILEIRSKAGPFS